MTARRVHLSLEQKNRLRLHELEHPGISKRDLQTWAQQEFKVPVGFSTVCKISGTAIVARSTAARAPVGRFPELERERPSFVAANAGLTDSEIWLKANAILKRMYSDTSKTVSTGWVPAFKKRWGVHAAQAATTSSHEHNGLDIDDDGVEEEEQTEEPEELQTSAKLISKVPTLYDERAIDLPLSISDGMLMIAVNAVKPWTFRNDEGWLKVREQLQIFSDCPKAQFCQDRTTLLAKHTRMGTVVSLLDDDVQVKYKPMHAMLKEMVAAEDAFADGGLPEESNLNGELQRKVEAQRAEDKQEFDTQVAKFRDEISRINQQHESEINRIKQQHKSDVSLIEHAHETEVSAMTGKHAAEASEKTSYRGEVGMELAASTNSASAACPSNANSSADYPTNASESTNASVQQRLSAPDFAPAAKATPRKRAPASNAGKEPPAKKPRTNNKPGAPIITKPKAAKKFVKRAQQGVISEADEKTEESMPPIHVLQNVSAPAPPSPQL